MRALLLALVLAGSSLAVLPAASASDPCGAPDRAVRTPDLVLGLHTGPCAGVSVTLYGSPCVDMVWGVFTKVAGVGGHDGCHAMAYADPHPILNVLA